MPYCPNCDQETNHDYEWCVNRGRTVKAKVLPVTDEVTDVTSKVTNVTHQVTELAAGKHCPTCRCQKLTNAEKQRAYRERRQAVSP